MPELTYRAVLCNSAGELDVFSADSLEALQRQLGQRLIDGTWQLDDGDTIVISYCDATVITKGDDE